MSTRTMVDAANPAAILALPASAHYELVGGYTTGTPGTAWRGKWDQFAGKTLVTIDQASVPGAPDYNAMVIDVEPNCYRPEQIQGWMDKSTWERPTVYCDRSDLPAVRRVWHGAVWLAAPGVKSWPDPMVIGIQNGSGDGYDVSDIFDPYWPHLAPTPPPTGDAEMLHGMLSASGQEFIPFPAGSFKGVIIFHDFTHVPEPVRVAVHSKTKGYDQIKDITVDNSVPVELTFNATDVDAVSLVNRSNVPVGWTLT